MMEVQNSGAQSQPIQKTDADGTKMVGGQVGVVADGAGAGVRVDVGNAVEVVKRKRGRPPKSQANQPSAKKIKEDDGDEDVCFICFDGGSLVLCDRRGCPKAYHPACIKRDEAFFQTKAKWNCGWHLCSVCEKASHHMCYTCTYSLCKGCSKQTDFMCVRGDKGFCTVCLKMITLIEHSAQGKEVKVDFDDKSSWEYLFKVYWLYTKGKLSLTFDEITQAQNPCERPDTITSIKPTVHINPTVRRSITSELSNLEANERKIFEQTNVPPKETTPSSVVVEHKEWASKELLDFVSHMKNGDVSFLSQFDVQALLLEYIKINNLRDPRKKTQIICDTRLKNLFGKPRVGQLEMLKVLESHFYIKEDSLLKNNTNISESSVKQVDDCKPDNMVVVSNKERRNHRKAEQRVSQNKMDEYASIDVHNMNLIYLRRNLMEKFVEDSDKFHEKVVGSIVQIRISGSDQKDDMYRLVQVVGTTKVDVPYKVGDKSVDIMLEVSNLDKKETVPIDTISNQELSEDECRRLRESIRCGLVRCFTVGEIQEKAMALQSLLVDDRMEAEILRLNNLCDRASEKRQKKGLRECLQKLKLLKTSEERERRLREVPEVHSDPKMNPDYESDDTEEYFNNEHGEHQKPKFSWATGTTNNISPQKRPETSNDQNQEKDMMGITNSPNVEEAAGTSNTEKDTMESSPMEEIESPKEVDCNGSTIPESKIEILGSSSLPTTIVPESTPIRIPESNIPTPVSSSPPATIMQESRPSRILESNIPIQVSPSLPPTIIQESRPSTIPESNIPTLARSSVPAPKVRKSRRTTILEFNNPTPVSSSQPTTIVPESAPSRILESNIPAPRISSQPTTIVTESRPFTITESNIQTPVSSSQVHTNVVQESRPFTIPESNIPTPVSSSQPTTVAPESRPSRTPESNIQTSIGFSRHTYTVPESRPSRTPESNIPNPVISSQPTTIVPESRPFTITDSNIATIANPSVPAPRVRKSRRSRIPESNIPTPVSSSRPATVAPESRPFTISESNIPTPVSSSQRTNIVPESRSSRSPESNIQTSVSFSRHTNTVLESRPSRTPESNIQTSISFLRHTNTVPESRPSRTPESNIQTSVGFSQHTNTVPESRPSRTPESNIQTSMSFSRHTNAVPESRPSRTPESNIPTPVISSIPTTIVPESRPSTIPEPNIPTPASSSQPTTIVPESTPSSFLSMLEHPSPSDDMWHYRDPSGNIQGPFSMLQLQQWSIRRYFPDDMRVWAGRENDSVLLNDVLQEQFNDNYNTPWPTNVSTNEKVSNQIEDVNVNVNVNVPETSYQMDSVNLEKLPNDNNYNLNCNPSTGPDMDINQHVSSQAFPVADEALVDLQTQLLKKDSPEKVKAEPSGNQNTQPSTWSTALSLVIGGTETQTQTQIPETSGGDEWGRYPQKHEEWGSTRVSVSPIKPLEVLGHHHHHHHHQHQHHHNHNHNHHQVGVGVGVATTSMDQIMHHASPPHTSQQPYNSFPAWHGGLGETIEFPTLAEESVSDLLAEVESMESRNGVPSPTSRRNSFLEDLFNGSMDDFSPTDQDTDMHLHRQSTHFSFGLDTKPTGPVNIPATNSDHMGFKWSDMVPPPPPPPPPRQDMIDLNDSTRAEADESERDDQFEERSQNGILPLPPPPPQQPPQQAESRGGRRSKGVVSGWPEKEKESERERERERERIKERKFSGFPHVEEEEGEFIQPDAPPPPPPPPQAQPPLLPLPTQPPLTMGFDLADSRRMGSDKYTGRGTSSGSRVHNSRSVNVGPGRESQSHHRRSSGGDREKDRYNNSNSISNSISPRERTQSHHGDDRSSRASWGRQSSFGSGGGGGSGYARTPPSKVQRVCKFYESGRCKKGSSCSFLHPQQK